MTEKTHIFEAEILAASLGGAMVVIPFSVREAFGTGGQVKVRATFDGHPYRGSIAPMGGGTHSLGVRKDVRAAIGKDIGDVVSVSIERDTEPRIVKTPPELAAALKASSAAAARYERLSYTHRREFAQWVAEGKKQETRDRRAARAIDMLLEGETR